MPPPTTILFLIPSLVAHGAERQLCELVRHMDRRRFQVHVAVFYGPGPDLGPGLWNELAAVSDVTLHCLDKRRGALGYLGALPRLLRLILRIRPKIVHGYMDGNLPILLLGRILGKRVVWGIRRTSKDPSQLDRLSRTLLRAMVLFSGYVDLVIFNSEAGRSNHAAMGMRARRMTVVPNGFDLDRFRPEPDLGAAQRTSWGIPLEVPLIGIVGRLDPVKDHPTFLRAVARVAREWPMARFVCAGGGPGAYQGALETLAVDLGLEPGRVLFPGACEDMVPVYNALSLLVLSSTDEGFPNAIGEAMACGVPCVTTRVGDAAILVGPWGRVAEPGDDEAIGAAVSSLLRESPEARACRADGCRRHIAENFSLDALAGNTESLLSSLVAAE